MYCRCSECLAQRDLILDMRRERRTVCKACGAKGCQRVACKLERQRLRDEEARHVAEEYERWQREGGRTFSFGAL